MRNIFAMPAKAGFIVGVLASVLISTQVMAAQTPEPDTSITISPTKKIYNLEAGRTLNDSVTVFNDGDTDYTFTVYASPYSVSGESYDPDFFNEKENTNLHKWLRTEKKSYQAKAGESIRVNFTINVPANARPGGHYGALFAETQPSGPAEGTSVQRKQRVGALMFATVKGEFAMGGRFNGIETPFLQFKAPLKSDVNVENTGNSDFNVETVMGVTDLFGNVKYSEKKEYRVLPETKRKITHEWKNLTPFGFYKVTTSAKFLDEKTSKSTYVLMAPISYYMIFVVGFLVAVIYFVQKRR